MKGIENTNDIASSNHKSNQCYGFISVNPLTDCARADETRKDYEYNAPY
jgi:hypothetical protein